MNKKKFNFFTVAATLCCSLFLFSCSGNENSAKEAPVTEEQEIEEVEEVVPEMLKRDSIKMDSMKRELLKKTQ